MPLASDHKALLFLAAVAVLGAGVRVVRAARGEEAQPALDHQVAVSDSAARVNKRPRKTTSARDTVRRRKKPVPVTQRYGAGPLDRPGYMFGKLDLDVATVEQIDSLPGVGPSLARKIVADRAANGPFVTRAGFQRVRGISASVMRRIDTLVMFSGTYRR
jgi:competence protein ComEA